MTRFDWFLLRLSLSGKVPFVDRILAWRQRRAVDAKEPVSRLGHAFEIPDLARPFPEKDRGPLDPSAELVPFFPRPVAFADVAGRRVDAISSHVGTYGMGGPGYFGFRLGGQWLVLAIRGAGDWMRVDGRHVTGIAGKDHDSSRPWIGAHGDDLGPCIIGSMISALDVRQTSLRLEFSNGMVLTIDDAPRDRPGANRRADRRIFLETDDLRRAVFLSPTDEIWV